MDIQTRPISDLPEMSKDSQTAQLMVYDEADQTPKRMPRSVMPVFVNFAINIISLDDNTFSISATHSPSEIKELLLAKIPVVCYGCVSRDGYDGAYDIGTGSCSIWPYDASSTLQEGIEITIPTESMDAVVFHAIDGSNVWEIGPLPKKSST